MGFDVAESYAHSSLRTSDPNNSVYSQAKLWGYVAQGVITSALRTSPSLGTPSSSLFRNIFSTPCAGELHEPRRSPCSMDALYFSDKTLIFCLGNPWFANCLGWGTITGRDVAKLPSRWPGRRVG